MNWSTCWETFMRFLMISTELRSTSLHMEHLSLRSWSALFVTWLKKSFWTALWHLFNYFFF